jgi:hypothetical protein
LKGLSGKRQLFRLASEGGVPTRTEGP